MQIDTTEYCTPMEMKSKMFVEGENDDDDDDDDTLINEGGKEEALQKIKSNEIR